MLLVDLKSGPGEGVLAPGLLSAHILLLSSSEVWQTFLGSGYLIPDSRPTKLQSTELTGSNLSRHTWEPGSPISGHRQKPGNHTKGPFLIAHWLVLCTQH